MRLLRMALEEEAVRPQASEQPEGPTIEMRGPLAEIYRKALDVVLAKKDSVTGEPTIGQREGIATETMANDALVARAMKRLEADAGEQVLDGKAPANTSVTVYGVSLAQVSKQDVVEVTRLLNERQAPKSGQDCFADFYLVLDATGPGPNSEVVNAGEEKYMRLGQALESVALACGCKVVRDFAEIAPTLARL